jgi:hypothetical protein
MAVPIQFVCEAIPQVNCKSLYRLPNFVTSFTEFTSQVSLRISDQHSHFYVDHLNHQAGRGHFDDLIHLHRAVGQLLAVVVVLQIKYPTLFQPQSGIETEKSGRSDRRAVTSDRKVRPKAFGE